jgi:hypothetical protein
MTLKLDVDLREDPRYPVADLQVGVRFADGAAVTAEVADISLNGALLDFAVDPAGEPGDGLQLSFSMNDGRSFAASARLVYVRGKRSGVEFLAFDAADFEVLTELIGELRRARVARLLAGRNN